MLKPRMIFVVSLFSLAGCPAKLLPDPLGAHRLAREETVHVLVTHPDGKDREIKVKYPAGSVIATPEAVRAADK